MSNLVTAAPETIASQQKDYGRHYQNSQPANFIRGLFFQVATALKMDTTVDATDVGASSICERYSIENVGVVMDLIIKGSKPTGMWNATILDSSTYQDFNKNLQSLIECLQDTDVPVVVEAMQKLMQLFRQGYRFDCDFDGKTFNIRFEHRPCKFFSELTVIVK